MIRNYSFSKFIKAYFLNGFVGAFNNTVDEVWTPFTAFPLGKVVTHTYITGFESVTNKYIAISGVKTGNLPPVHNTQGAIVSDGGMRWLYVDTLSNIDSGMDNLYVTFGRPNEWEGGDFPPDAYITAENTPDSISNIIYAKKIDKNFISMVVDRNNWETGKVFDEFSSAKKSYKHPHYTTNTQGKIYFCLYNNSGKPSTVEPVGESSEPINTTDNYIWLYVGKININSTKFLTDDYIPVNKDIIFNPNINSNRGGIAAIDLNSKQIGTFAPTDTVEIEVLNAGGGSGAQFNVIKNTAGVIEHVEVVSTGKDYSPNTSVVIKNTAAQGFGATATADVNVDGTIASITVTAIGQGYTDAVVIIEGDGEGAEAKAQISSVGKISNITITNAGKGYTYANVYIVSGNSAKRCSVRLLPYNTNKVDLLSTFNNASLMFLVEISPSAEYFPYDTYYRECMLVVNMLEKGTSLIADKNEYIGKGHTKWADPNTPLRKLDDRNGFILFRQNTEKLLHVASQSEMVKLIISL